MKFLSLEQNFWFFCIRRGASLNLFKRIQSNQNLVQGYQLDEILASTKLLLLFITRLLLDCS